MSLVTLGSVPYNPYNDTLAQMAVSGIKLGMENLDAMERNNQFSISETSKAFAAVADNLIKGKELQLRAREADRMDRTQAFNEFEFGEKMDYEKGRAEVADNQWLKTFEQNQKEFQDTQTRTGLAERETTLREQEFQQRKKEYDDAAVMRAATVQKMILDSAAGTRTEPAKTPAVVTEAIQGTEKLLTMQSEQLKQFRSAFDIANRGGIEEAMSQPTEVEQNEFEKAGQIEKNTPTEAPGLTTPAPTKADGSVDIAAAKGNLAAVAAGNQSTRRKIDPKVIEDLREQIEAADQKNKILAQHYTNLTMDPLYFGSKEYNEATSRIKRLFDVADKGKEGAGTESFKPKNSGTTSDPNSVGD